MKKKYWLRYILASTLACTLVFGWALSIQADEILVEDEDNIAVEETSVYQNQAQAAHDANLEAAAFEKIDSEIASLQDELVEAEAEGDDDRIAELNAEIDERVSDRTGIEDGRIADLRESGMGWGEIAHELDVHPGVLGLGHTKMQGEKWKSSQAKLTGDEEIRLATTMDLNSGATIGHGKKSGVSGSSREDKGRSEKNNGKSNDKGNNGNNDNNGGGKGNNGGGNGKSK